MQKKPKVMQTSFPDEWNPNCPETVNKFHRHIRYLLHSEGDIHRLAKVNIGQSFEKLKQSINPKNK